MSIDQQYQLMNDILKGRNISSVLGFSKGFPELSISILIKTDWNFAS